MGRFYPRVWQVWLTGAVSTAHISALATGTEPLSIKVVGDIIRAVLPRICDLTPAEVAKAAAKARGVVDPDGERDREQGEYDRRRLTIRPEAGGVRISGVLPKAEGLALTAMVEAYAERLRVEADGLSRTQRRADGLAAVVAAAADTTQPCQGGLPAGVVMTISLTEAERIAAGRDRDPQQLADR